MQENKQFSYDILVSHIIVVDPVTPQFIPRQIGLIKNRSEGVKSGFPQISRKVHQGQTVSRLPTCKVRSIFDMMEIYM